MKVKRKKILYIPGLLSLILIVPLCSFYFYSNNYFVRYKVLEVMWLNKSNDNEYNLNTFNYITSRKNINIELIGDDKIDKERLRWGQSEINKLLKSKDTSLGVHFHFSKTTTYESFIRVLNICIIEGATTYTPYEDEFWVVNEIPEPPVENERFICDVPPINICGGNYFSNTEYNYYKKQQEVKLLKKAARILLIPIFIYILMVVLSIRKIASINRNNVKTNII